MTHKKERPYNSKDKWVISLLTGLLFMLVASPFLFSMTNQITRSFGMTIATYDGCPNIAGLMIHSMIFGFIVRLMMR